MESKNEDVSKDCRFRSWGENQIARFLDRHKIPYQYEYPVALIDRSKTRLYYPDFRLPEYGVIIEYFGINGRPDYDECTRHKMEIYKQAGIEGVFLNRESFRGDWPTRIMDQIEGTLRTRLNRFLETRGNST